MEKIASFTVDHTKLKEGVYVSRLDGDIVTYDLRMRKPNTGDLLSNAVMHSFEHMFATLVRNSSMGERVIYFGPMGCRTGFYLLLSGDYKSEDIVPLMKELFTFIRDFDDEVPGASPRDCGNYLDMNLPMANYLAKEYLDRCLNVIGPENLNYPE